MFKVEEETQAVNLQLRQEQLNRLFPYHIVLSRDLKMISVGYKLQGLYKSAQLTGLFFSDYFTTHFPENIELTFENLLCLRETSINISNQRISLSAQVEYNDKADFLFIAILFQM